MIISLTTIQINRLIELGLLNDRFDNLIRFRIWKSDMDSGDASLGFFYLQETVNELEEMGIDIDLVYKMYENEDCDISAEISNDEFSDICQFDITIQEINEGIEISGFYAENQTTLF
jgi:hypothetical protein